VLRVQLPFVGSSYLPLAQARETIETVQDRSARVPRSLDFAEQNERVFDYLLGRTHCRLDSIQVIGVREVLVPDPVK
jgi:hypothetical protein